MDRLFLCLILFPLISFCQSTNDNTPLHWQEKHRVKHPIEHLSVGIFSNETAYSVISYTRNILRGANYDRGDFVYFVACGTNIIQSSISLGVKKPILESDLNKVLYSSISIRGVYSIGKWDDFIAPSIGLALDIPLSNHPHYKSRYSSKIGEILKEISPGIKQKEFINIGVSSTIRFNENRIRAIIIPNLNLSYRW